MVQRTEIQEKNLQRVERDGPCDMFFSPSRENPKIAKSIPYYC